MKKPKLDVLIAMFAYGGNGGISTVLPTHVTWLMQRYLEMMNDDRIDRVAIITLSDTPITMTRNKAVKEAKEKGFDVLIMLDSDNVPDLYLGHRPEAKPFWATSFDFLYERTMRGVPTVVCSPYCGPPPHPTSGGSENVYCFFSTQSDSNDDDPSKHGTISIEAYSREHAAIMRGIQPIAAGPTGVIGYTVDSFDLMPICSMSDDEILSQHKSGELTTDRAKQLLRLGTWFQYEYTDNRQTEKSTTEDVWSLREINFAGIDKHKEPIVFCNWDAWAGHYKPKCVGAPMPLRIEQVSEVFREAVMNNISVGDSIQQVDFTQGEPLPPRPPVSFSFGYDSIPDATPPIVRQMRLGKVFDNPVVAESDLKEIAEYLELVGAKRVLVIGDETGEVCWSATCAADERSVFRISKDTTPIPDVKRLMESNPAKVCADFNPQGLDAVVIQCEGWSTVVESWFIKHVREGGCAVLIGALLVDGFKSIGGDVVQIEGSNIHVIEKPVVTTLEGSLDGATSL